MCSGSHYVLTGATIGPRLTSLRGTETTLRSQTARERKGRRVRGISGVLGALRGVRGFGGIRGFGGPPGGRLGEGQGGGGRGRVGLKVLLACGLLTALSLPAA